MKLYTSYWSQVRNFPKNLIGLNTTVWPPKWRALGQDKRGVWVVDCPPLKPGQECEGLCRGPETCISKSPKDCAFLRTYANQLNKINFQDFFNHLYQLYEDICGDEGFETIDFAFLVYEKYDNPCSERWPIQQWFKNHKIDIREWYK